MITKEPFTEGGISEYPHKPARYANKTKKIIRLRTTAFTPIYFLQLSLKLHHTVQYTLDR